MSNHEFPQKTSRAIIISTKNRKYDESAMWNCLTFWPLRDDSLLKHCHCGGWWVAERTNIRSVIEAELKLNKVLLRHFQVQSFSTLTQQANLIPPRKAQSTLCVVPEQDDTENESQYIHHPKSAINLNFLASYSIANEMKREEINRNYRTSQKRTWKKTWKGWSKG